MSNSTTPEPPLPHGLRTILFPTAEIAEITSHLYQLAQQGKITVIAVSYLKEEREVTQVITGDDVKLIRSWHTTWAVSDDIDLQKTVVRGAIGRLVDSFASETDYLTSGEPLED